MIEFLMIQYCILSPKGNNSEFIPPFSPYLSVSEFRAELNKVDFTPMGDKVDFISLGK